MILPEEVKIKTLVSSAVGVCSRVLGEGSSREAQPAASLAASALSRSCNDVTVCTNAHTWEPLREKGRGKAHNALLSNTFAVSAVLFFFFFFFLSVNREQSKCTHSPVAGVPEL